MAGRALPDDVFFVSPSEVANSVVYELIPLNVTTGSDAPIEASPPTNRWSACSRPKVKTRVTRSGWPPEDRPDGGHGLAEHRQGSQVADDQGHGQRRQDRVVGLAPPVYSLRLGQPDTANLVGTTQDGRIVKVWPGALGWEKQPRIENVDLNKQTLLMRPLEATEIPQDLQVRLAQLAWSPMRPSRCAAGRL